MTDLSYLVSSPSRGQGDMVWPKGPDRDTALCSHPEEEGKVLSALPPLWGPGEAVGWGGNCQGNEAAR